jgi:hypothetical protein
MIIMYVNLGNDLTYLKLESKGQTILFINNYGR